MTEEQRALIAKIEAATEPSRELDRCLAIEVGICLHDKLERSGAQSDTGFTCAHCGADTWGNVGKYGQKLSDRIPPFTSSIDAAMALVPDGWMLISILQPSVGLYRATLQGPDNWTLVYSSRASIPIAICIAALKARFV